MAAPVRILFPYVGDTVGGSHISSLKLAMSLDRDRFEPVVALHGPGLLPEYLDGLGIVPVDAPPVVPPRLRARWKQWHRIRGCRKTLLPWLAEQRIDIIHTHDMRMHLAWSAAAGAARLPHIWHQRTPMDSPNAAAHAAASARVIAVSEFVRDSFAANLKPRAEVIYNPFDLPAPQDRELSRRRILDDMGLSEADAIIGFVSNLSQRKRPELFVDIAQRLQTMRPDLRLAFPMFGEARAPLDGIVRQRIAEAGMERQIRLMGTRFPFDPWLAGFDMLIGPARNEALGRTLIEATMAGVPLVATREGGNLEIVEHEKSGLLAPPDDAGAFAGMAARLLDAPDHAKQLADAARAYSRETFSLAPHLGRMTGIYDALTAAR